MDTLIVIVLLSITCQIIATEPYSQSETCQLDGYKKCHHYMEPLRRTQCMYEHMLQHKNCMDDKLETLEADLANYNVKLMRHESDMELNTDNVEEGMTELNFSIKSLGDRIEKVQQKTEGDFSNIQFYMDKSKETFQQSVTDLDKSFNSEMNEMKQTLTDTDSKVDELEKDMTETFEHSEKTFNSRIASQTEMIQSMKSDTEQELNNGLTNLRNELEGTKLNLVKKIGELDNVSTEKNRKRDNQIIKLEDTLKRDVNFLEDNLIIKVKSLKDDVDMILADMKEKTQDQFVASDKRFGDIENKLAILNSDFNQFKIEVNNKIDAAVAKLQNQVDDVNIKLESAQRGMQEQMDLQKTEFNQEMRQHVNELLLKAAEVNQTIVRHGSVLELLRANSMDKGTLLMVIFALASFVGINYFIVYIIVKRTKPKEVINNNNKSGSVSLRGRTSVKALIGQSAILNDCICILSFSEQSQKQNKSLMKTVLREPPAVHADNAQYHVIRQHDDITETPLTKLCFMFVEFTERHVIIEEQGLGLGDLKRSTYNYLTDLGVCLVIVYVRDPESRQLAKDDLYNTNIRCVSIQPELIALRDQDQFISMYNEPTKRQMKHMVHLINKTIQNHETMSDDTM